MAWPRLPAIRLIAAALAIEAAIVAVVVILALDDGEGTSPSESFYLEATVTIGTANRGQSETIHEEVTKLDRSPHFPGGILRFTPPPGKELQGGR